jgi:hypothetical protein
MNPSVRVLVPKRAFAAPDIPRVRALLAAHAERRSPMNPFRRILLLWVLLIVAFLAIWQLFEMDEAEPPLRDELEDVDLDE